MQRPTAQAAIKMLLNKINSTIFFKITMDKQG